MTKMRKAGWEKCHTEGKKTLRSSWEGRERQRSLTVIQLTHNGNV
jgi:hypothetical protein